MMDIPVLLILGAIAVGLYARLPHWAIGIIIVMVLLAPFAERHRNKGGK